MADSHALPAPLELDLDLEFEDEPTLLARRPPADPGRVASGAPSSRVVNREKNRPTRRNMPSVHDESTRIVAGDALAQATRPPPPPSDDGATRACADVDVALLAVGTLDGAGDLSPASRASSQPPSGSGIAARDGKVAAMRELYASGDADGALVLASALASSLPPPPPERAPSTRPSPSRAPQLTLTQRQSIPRVLKSLAEVSKLKMDHRAGFLLAHVDGMHTLEEILDICAMPPAEALAHISNLEEMGVIEFE